MRPFGRIWAKRRSLGVSGFGPLSATPCAASVIKEITAFAMPELFTQFGLPPALAP